MEQQLIELVDRARGEQAVAIETLTNGMQMLVYPLERGAVVAIGYPAGLAHPVLAENVLRLRSGDLRRFGGWLPAMLADGSLYVVRRIDAAEREDGMPAVPEDALQAAREMLA